MDAQNLQIVKYKKESKGFTALLVTGKICNTVGDSYAIKLDNLFTSLSDYAFASPAINTIGVAEGTYPFNKVIFPHSPLDTYVYNVYFKSFQPIHDDDVKKAFETKRMATLQPEYKATLQVHGYKSISDVGYYKTALYPFHQQYAPEAMNGAFESKILDAGSIALHTWDTYTFPSNATFTTLYDLCKIFVAEINKEWENFLNKDTHGRPNRIMLINEASSEEMNISVLAMLATDSLLANPPAWFVDFADIERVQFLTMLPLVTMLPRKLDRVIIYIAYAIGRMLDLNMIEFKDFQTAYDTSVKGILKVLEKFYSIDKDPQSMTTKHYSTYQGVIADLVTGSWITESVARHLNEAWKRQYVTYETSGKSSSSDGDSEPTATNLHEFGKVWYDGVPEPK